MAKTYRKKFVAAKIETTKGTAESLVAANYKILAFDPVLDQDINFADRRPAGIAMGRLESIPEEYKGTAKLRVELKGSGSSSLPVFASTLLLACGFKSTAITGGVRLDLVSSVADQKCATIGLVEDGMLKVLSGAMGDFEIVGEAGKVAYIDFNMRGIWNLPVDASQPTGITQESTLPLRTADMSLTLGGAAFGKLSRWSFRAGNDVQLRWDMEQVSAIAHAYVADRSPMFAMDPEAVSVADDDLFGDSLAGVTSALAMQLPKDASAVAGNQILIDAPKVQRTNPKTSNRNGLQSHDIEAIVVGGDEAYTISFK